MSDQNPATNSRRDVIKKAAVVGGAAWAAPMIMSSRAFAQGSLSTNLCVNTNCSVTSVTYRFNGGNPTYFALCAPPDGNNAAKGGGDTYGPFVVGGPPVTWTAWKFTGNVGNNCGNTADAPSGATSLGSGTLVPGTNNTFTVGTGAGGPNIKVRFAWEENGDAKVSWFCYHLSCSQPLCFLDTHGPATLMSYTVSGC